LIRTFETRVRLSGGKRDRLDGVLSEYAALMSRAERLLLAKLKAGRVWTGDLKVSAYKPLGISATHLDMAYRQLMARLSSVAELANENSKALTAKIASKKVDIKRKEAARGKVRKKLRKAEGELRSLQERLKERRKLLVNATASDHADCLFALKVRLDELHAKRAAVVGLRREVRNFSFALHQHKRRLAILQDRAEPAEIPWAELIREGHNIIFDRVISLGSAFAAHGDAPDRFLPASIRPKKLGLRAGARRKARDPVARPRLFDCYQLTSRSYADA